MASAESPANGGASTPAHVNAAARPQFTVPPALAAARGRKHYISCPACGADVPRYLFYRAGARFVICRACGLVYADPVDPEAIADFDLAASPVCASRIDLESAAHNFSSALRGIAATYEKLTGGAPHSVLVVGRWHPEFERHSEPFTEVRTVTDLTAATVAATEDAPAGGFDVVFLNGVVEQITDAHRTFRDLAPVLKPETLVAVEFSNMGALPSRVLRRRWKRFFDNYLAYFDADNLNILMWRSGFERVSSLKIRWRYSLSYMLRRLEFSPRLQRGLARTRLAVSLASGREIALFRMTTQPPHERLSIVVPVYNEALYVGAMITALLELDLPIEHEVIVVESNSTDGSNEIVRSFEGHPLLRVIYQDAAGGKGIAVRDGLHAATGSILMIQDADFEYDLDDYEALLEPIVERRASFVLGSRSLGLDDWRIRRYETAKGSGFALNIAHLAFARTFNLLYQQRATDINTMFKVFRRECIDGISFEGNGFNFDIELVCKIVRNGFAPFEVPVNYNSRGFDEGKKITLADAWPSYYQLFRCRFGRL